MRTTSYRYFVLFFLFLVQCTGNEDRNYPRRAEVLFMGAADGEGPSSRYASWLAITLFKSGVNLTYTSTPDRWDARELRQFDGVIAWAGSDLSAGTQQALSGFAEDGKGVVIFGGRHAAHSNMAWFAALIDGRPASGNASVALPDSSLQVLRGKGRIWYTPDGGTDPNWKDLRFLQTMADGVRWALGEQVMNLVAQLQIPNVSIYEDTIADFTARHLVPKMQDPLSPDESAKLIQVPVGFELKLFAAEPNIVNPIAMTWDEKGRLWVIETVDYPNNFVELKGEANDRIKICEDTDGDGVADKFTVFAEGLNIATSLTFANDGVIVAMAPHFLFLKDTDGDGVADTRDTLMTGWGKFDTHAGPSNLQYGFDNRIWGVVGFSGFNGYINGQRQVFGQGLYRFRPDGTEFEYLATTSNNTWGLGMSEDNNVFLSTANNTHSAFYSMPERLMQRRLTSAGRPDVYAVQKIDGHYEVHALTPNLRQVDVVGGFTSAAGHQMYTARDYPQAFWNRAAFVAEPTVRLIHHAVIAPDGAGFKEQDGWNFAASSDEWFGPIHAEVGPDGAVWILDWYNFIIQHNVFVPEQAPSEFVLPFIEQPHGPGNAFESDLRDKKYGRVYRLVHREAKHKSGHKLSKSDVDGLLTALKSDNKFWRMHAQRLLVERGNADVTEALIRIASDRKVDPIGLNAPAIHALWTLHGLNLIEPRQQVFDAVTAALKHPSPGVRKAAVQVLPTDDRSLDALLKAGVQADTNLNTRLAVFVKLSEFPASARIAEALLNAAADSTNANDRWLSQALFAAVTHHEEAFIAAASGHRANPFVDRILAALQYEQYVLGRRTRVQFSPDVAQKAIRIQADVSRRENRPFNGLIVGQGDRSAGYALFMRNNRLFFEVYQHGQTTSVASRGPVPEKFRVEAELAGDATVNLSINGQQQATAKAMHLFTDPLKLYLRSGEDLEGEEAFTDYGGRSAFTGNVGDITVQLVPSGRADVLATGTDKATEMSAPSALIELKAQKDIMQYDKKQFTVRAGERITLIFENPDGMQHNLLIVQPGSLEIVGKAADDMLRSSEAYERQYIPDIPEVLFHTPLVNPGDRYTLEFTAPAEPGDYPYVCTFPGHWRGMNGIMRVVNR